MSGLLPVQGAAPAPARTDGTIDTRRSADGEDRFAAQLATARTARKATPDTREAAPTPRTRPASRAQSQSMLLNGAMRYSAIRGDASPARSAPDVALAGDCNDAPAAESTDAAATEVTTLPAELPIAGTLAAQPDVTLLDAPAVTTVSTPVPAATRGISLLVDAPAGERVADVAVDASVLAPSAATTAAAMALVATLPVLVPEAPAMVDIDVALDADAHTGSGSNADGTPLTTPASDDAAQQSRIAALAQLHDALTALPDAAPATTPVLLEDHFDAPASAMPVATEMGTTIDAAPVDGFAAWLRGDDDPLTASIAKTAADSAAAAVSATSGILAAIPSAGSTPSSGGVKGSTAVIRDLSVLAPEFREKLERVIERMRAEYGRDVSVVETGRTQERQDALYAQGRTTPGPVVTWTRNSRHSKGLAADLIVDGKWNNPEGYADLATVAEEEGLRTLGSRDAGHVELPGQRGVSAETLGTLLGDLQGEAGDTARQASATLRTARPAAEASTPVSGLARVAEVAQVARVATVAQVARVAEVARPGAPRASHATSDAAMPTLAVGAVNTVTADTALTARVVTPAVPVNMAERISQLMDLQATQASKPLNSVLLRMGDGGGIEDQIRIDTRGTSVDARLGLGNAQQAAALTDRIGELRDALERRGLVAEGVRVQATTRPTDSVSFSRPVQQVVEMAATRAASDSQQQGMSRDGRDQQEREALAREQQQSRPSQRSSADDARNRSRREQQEARR